MGFLDFMASPRLQELPELCFEDSEARDGTHFRAETSGGPLELFRADGCGGR